MSGETDLDRLLAAISPALDAEEYVFCTFHGAAYGDRADLAPVASVAEQEGLTLVVRRSTAGEHGLPYGDVFRRITLNVHSSLTAVGLTAAFSKALAERGISANVVAGYHHDHVFVPQEQAEGAVAVIQALAG